MNGTTRLNPADMKNDKKRRDGLAYGGGSGENRTAFFCFYLNLPKTLVSFFTLICS